MSTVQTPTRLLEEIADLFASSPDHDQVLGFQPSEAVRRRAGELLAKLRNESLAPDEQRELDQFEQAELLMRLVKARLRGREAE